MSVRVELELKPLYNGTPNPPQHDFLAQFYAAHISEQTETLDKYLTEQVEQHREFLEEHWKHIHSVWLSGLDVGNRAMPVALMHIIMATSEQHSGFVLEKLKGADDTAAAEYFEKTWHPFLRELWKTCILQFSGGASAALYRLANWPRCAWLLRAEGDALYRICEDLTLQQHVLQVE